MQALKNGQIDGIVVDLPTAYFMTAVQLDDGVIVGQLPQAGGEVEQFGAVLDKDSPLTDCVSQAVDTLREDGTLDRPRRRVAGPAGRSRAVLSPPADAGDLRRLAALGGPARARRVPAAPAHDPQRVVALVSTVVAARRRRAAVVTSPGWERVQETYFDWDKAVDSFPAVLEGLWLNIRVMLVCAVLIVLLSLTIAVMRTMRGPVAFPLRLLGTVYVDVFRGLPLLLVLFLLGFGGPALDLSGLPARGPLLGVCGPGAVLLGLRRRGVPGRHRVGPPDRSAWPGGRSA